MSLQYAMITYDDLSAFQSIFTYENGHTERATVLEEMTTTRQGIVAIKLYHRDKYGDNALLYFPHQFDKMVDFLDRNCRDAHNYQAFLTDLCQMAFQNNFHAK